MAKILKITDAAPLVREGGKLIASAVMTAVKPRFTGADIAREMEKAGGDTVLRALEMGVKDPAKIREFKLSAMQAVKDHMLKINAGQAPAEGA